MTEDERPASQRTRANAEFLTILVAYRGDNRAETAQDGRAHWPSDADIPLEREMTPLGLRSPVLPPEMIAASCGKADEPASVRMCPRLKRLRAYKCPNSNLYQNQR
jgi:hypothetical protein